MNIESKVFIVKQVDELSYVADYLKERIQKPCLILLEGDLGAGKTTFIQYLALALGIEEKVNSPTFTKIHEYIDKSNDLTIYHLDLYREIPSIDELEEILQDETGIVCIEWANRLNENLEYEGLLNLRIQKWSLKIKLNQAGFRELEVNQLN
jgi:tRNA threonylcarbamoyladenosine biosynthesis protein TsaE